MLAPGPGVLLTVATGLARGCVAALVAAFGCTLGVAPHLIAAISGAAAVLAARPALFDALKLAGAAWLLVLAWRALREAETPPRAEDAAHEGRSGARLILSAILLNLLNPKLSLFFLALLPQFVDAAGPGALVRMLALGLAFMGLTFVVFVCYGLAAACLGDAVLARPRLARWMGRATVAAFAALGLRLAFSP